MSGNDFLGRGLRFPIGADPSTGRFLESEEEDKIAESIKMILMTRKGERLMRPEYGCDIWQYIFEVTDYTTLSLMEAAAKDALTRWEPRIQDTQVTAEPIDRGFVLLHISCIVRAANNPFNLVFPFYLEEGIPAE